MSVHFAWIGHSLTVFSGHALWCKQAKCSLSAGDSLISRGKTCQIAESLQSGCLSEIADAVVKLPLPVAVVKLRCQ